ncbi:DNA protecting protein DprA (DNA processing chain A) [Elusimicrobium minutum Pei191]|uniref:DNA protecting protein DprA (DNA processing chain A) n=1 Tax=Elusimicrobium minutum (strain Pei191) TaxID=445932 RepID=B2KBN5_ELUMP|nr:DNA-processing protein DprA [Elusimicrobium minutum]ACC97722.1 DNA protecting protein DprA (DNA processing chain A) [Elusimicrobium minutum Pei191]
MITDSERLARIKLNAFTYLRTDWAMRMIEVFGSAEMILKTSAKDLAAQGGMSEDTAANLLKEAHALDAEKEAELTNKAGGKILLLEDYEYPQSLKDIKDPPFVLYVRGTLEARGPKVAMVGTRLITPYGRRCAKKFATEIAQAGCVVVSGLARGVDSVCQQAVVDINKPTWAVVGTGIGRCYPAENKALANAVLENGGAIISELSFNKPPNAFHFPRRNRIISALSSVVVIIEGKVRSGALITAKLAAEQGKDILAVPGSIESEQSGGPNMLIKDGAHALLETRDIIDLIPFEERFGLNEEVFEKDSVQKEILDLTETEKQFLEVIGPGEHTIDDIVEALATDVPSAAAVLFEMEIKGVLMCKDGKYSRNNF